MSSAEFKAWFAGSKVVDQHGNPLRVFRGDYRADRIKGGFKPGRGVAGRTLYFTDDPEIASGYANKFDEQHYENNQNYGNWFRFPGHRYPRERHDPDLKQLWWRLTPEEKNRVKQVVLSTNREYDKELGTEKINFDAGQPLSSRDDVEQIAQQFHGNWLLVAEDLWLNSGALFDDEETFGQLLQQMGLRHIYDNPREARSVVTPVYLAIKNPLDTSAIPASVVETLREVAKRDRSRVTLQNAGQWDAQGITAKTWFNKKLLEDLKDGTTYAWTVIPRKIVDALQRLGYDGIKDEGGKHSAHSHTVWIVFSAEQVKPALTTKIAQRERLRPFYNAHCLCSPLSGEP